MAQAHKSAHQLRVPVKRYPAIAACLERGLGRSDLQRGLGALLELEGATSEEEVAERSEDVAELRLRQDGRACERARNPSVTDHVAKRSSLRLEVLPTRSHATALQP